MRHTKLALTIGAMSVLVGGVGFRHAAEPVLAAAEAARTVSALLDYDG